MEQDEPVSTGQPDEADKYKENESTEPNTLLSAFKIKKEPWHDDYASLNAFEKILRMEAEAILAYQMIEIVSLAGNFFSFY